MVKSFTKNAKKKPTKDMPSANDVATITDLAQQYVQHWARTEAQKMAKDELVILPTKWGMQVGKYACKSKGKDWHVFDTFNDLIDVFTCKQSAVTYCILDQTNRFNMAWELLRQDTRISKLQQDKTYYASRKVKAAKSKDSLVMDVLDARMSEVDSLLNLAEQDLEKTLIKAKYLKGIWEQPL
jgi:hypothetical protein